MANDEDRLAKDVFWLGAISGILGGLFDADCIVDGFVEDVDPEEIEGFFLDEQEKRRENGKSTREKMS